MLLQIRPAARRNSLILVFLAASVLLAANPVQCGEWRWCGNIRPAEGRYQPIAPEGESENVHQTGAKIWIDANSGDVFCKCLSWAINSTQHMVELSVPLRDPEYGFSVKIAHPCLTAGCSPGGVSVPTDKAVAVQIHPSQCGLQAQRVEGGVAVEIKSYTELRMCSAASHFGKLLITSIFRSRNMNIGGPVLVTQAILLDVVSCSDKVEGHSLLTLQPHNLPSLAQSHSASPQRAHRRVVRSRNHSPQFDSLHYTATLQENSPIGTTVAVIQARDTDSGKNGGLTYSMRAAVSPSESLFRIDPLTGTVTTRGSLDRESMAQHQFVVTAVDGGGIGQSVQFSIVVGDENDNSPTFQDSSYFSLSLCEDLQMGPASLMEITVIDRDVGSNGQVEYQLLNNTNNTFTAIASESHVRLTLSRPLDHKTLDYYQLTLIARDKGNSPNSASATIEIHISGVADTPPQFDEDSYSVTVPEDRVMGSHIVTVHAEGSNGQVRYSSSDIDKKFNLNPSTGLITLARALDYERERYYSFYVMATGMGSPPRSSTAHVEITVADKNDNRPVFKPGVRTASVMENLPVHTSVLQLVAMDRDSGSNAALSFSIIADFHAIQTFSIDATGTVYTHQPLDREAKEVYSLTVQVQDNGQKPLSALTQVNVVVRDEIDYPPVFSQVAYEKRVKEETQQNSTLVSVSAITRDLVDPSSILYAVTGGENRTLFTIDQLTGVISAATMLHPVNHAGVYNLRVTAQHRHLSESVPVTITVREFDSVPILQPLTVYYNVFFSLIQPEVTRLGTVQIQERDEGVSYEFSLQASPSHIHRYFSIDPTSGDISVSSGVSSGFYSLNVSATSAAGTGYGLVEVYVNILTNTTLENAIVLVFGNVGEIEFASMRLEQFAELLTEIIPCQRHQVEIFSVQQSSSTEVAFAVRQLDLQSYIPPATILDRLLANQSLNQTSPSLSLNFASQPCVDEPCPNLQRCLPLVQAFRYSDAEPLRALLNTETIYYSHPFSLAHTCVCPEGYSKDGLCGAEIDECSPSPCYFRAPCEDLVGDYRCDCSDFTLGKNCSIACPSTSCDACTPSPCLHGSTCTMTTGSRYQCSNMCPWQPQYSGPNCELRSLQFSDGSFAAFPPLGNALRVSISFSFATVASSGMLLYNGRVPRSHDYIAVELVIGQLKVGVSLGGGAVSLQTQSVWPLNDGQWHDVSIVLDNQILSVAVSNCSSAPSYLRGVVESCHLETALSGQWKSLDVNGPLYLGGLESYLTDSPLPLSSLNYHGCIADVLHNGFLLDLASPTRSESTEVGCPPLEFACTEEVQRCETGECVAVWNGTVCQCEGDIPLCETAGSSVTLTSGYIELAAATTVGRFTLAFRTLLPTTVLATFGEAASLELRHGSVVYHRSQGGDHSALTLTVEDFASDGLWHEVTLLPEDSQTTLSLDEGRAVSTIPEEGAVSFGTLVLGNSNPSSGGSFTGCLGGLILNQVQLDLATALSTGIVYNATAVNSVVGCNGGSPCEGVECPVHSICDPQWQSYECVCDVVNEFQLRGDRCVDPCVPNPCQNDGTCLFDRTIGFQCQCEGIGGPTCAGTAECSLGFYNDPGCRPCVCDVEGVREDVCADNGQCSCRADLDLFNPPSDLSCQSCDCHVTGSTHPGCNLTSGQCDCRSNVVGRRCDVCAEGYAGMDSDGCREATVVRGSFVLSAVVYSAALEYSGSMEFAELARGVGGQLERELTEFALPGQQEVTITGLSDSSGNVRVEYRVSSYLPRASGALSHPSIHILAAVVQTIVQSGWVGSHQTTPTSHLVHMECVSRPCDPLSTCFHAVEDFQLFSCGVCSQGHQLDGIICREELAMGCYGIDTDRDGVPDSCDVCPFVFNPTQLGDEECERVEGVCEADFNEDILWSPTASGHADTKPCAFRLAGSVVRVCQEGGVWGEVDNSSCVSTQGQQLLLEVLALEEGQLLSNGEVTHLVGELVGFASEATLSTGDLQVAGSLLGQLVGLSGDAGMVQNLTVASSNLLHPRYASQWRSVAPGSGVSPSDLLNTLEQLSSQASVVLGSRGTIPEEYVHIETLSGLAGEFEGAVFNTPPVNDTSSAVEVPRNVTEGVDNETRIGVAVMQLPTMGLLLPEQFLFNDSRNLTVGGPVVVVRVGGEEGGSPFPLLVTLTLGHSRPGVQPPAKTTDAICVFWQYGESEGWGREGCGVLEVNSSHTVCQCSHLTAFTVLLPLAEPPPAESVESYAPQVFTYIVFGVVSILLLTILLLLHCVRSLTATTLDYLHTMVHRNFISALTLTGIIFIVGIGRTEASAVCSVLGVVLFFLLLACLSWLCAEGALITWSLLHPPTQKRFLVYLIVIGWATPLLLCAIATGVIAIASDSFVEDFGHPEYCWLAPEVVWAFIVPAVVLILLDLVALLVAMVILRRGKADTDNSTVNTAAAKRTRVSLCVSVTVLFLFVVTWVLGLLGVYGVSVVLEYLFAILYATLGVFLFIALCLNSKVQEACRSLFDSKNEDNDYVDESTVNSTAVDQFRFRTAASGVGRNNQSPSHINSLGVFHSTHHPQTFTQLEVALLPDGPPPPLPPYPGTPSTLPREKVMVTEEEPRPWFDVPDHPSPPPRNSDISSEYSDDPNSGAEGDDVSESVSELYQKARGRESPESYLEVSHEKEGSVSVRQPAEETPWYNQRDSQFEIAPMPYETAAAVMAQPSPLRSIRSRDFRETDSKRSEASPRPYDLGYPPAKLIQHSPCSSRSRSSHNSGASPDQFHRALGRVYAQGSPKSSSPQHSPLRPRQPLAMGLTWGMSRTGSDNLPRNYSPHSPIQQRNYSPHSPIQQRNYSPHSPIHQRNYSPHSPIHQRASESTHPHPQQWYTSEAVFRGNFPPGHPNSAFGPSSPSYPLPSPSFQNRTTMMSCSSPQQNGRGQGSPRMAHDTSLSSVRTGVSGSYHSNGPSMEDNLNHHVIRHVDGSETVESLV